MRPYLLEIGFVAAISFAMGISGCSSDSSSSGTVASTLLSGTAAGGAAVIGQACVKDSLFVEKCSLIDSFGGYSIDVSGMTAPFILRAKGQVGDTQVTYYSAATQADIGNKINITPFTDLIVSNLAGEIASNYYDSNVSLSGITSEALQTKIKALQEKLAPALLQLELDSSIDLLRASFNADHTGMDALIDLIKVDVNTTTEVATLINAITQTVISTDDFTSSLDDNDSVVLDTNLSTGLADIAAIKTKMNAFAQLFATIPPSLDDINNSGLFDTSETFINDGLTFTQFATMLSTNEEIIGMSFSNIAITFDDNVTGHVLANVLSKTGLNIDTIELILKKINGNWLVEGNGRIMDMSVHAEAQYYLWRSVIGSNDTNGSGMISALNFWIDPSLSPYADANISAHITGPGLGEGVDFTVKMTDGSLGFGSERNTTNWISQCTGTVITNCFDYNLTIDNGEYIVVIKDENGTSLNGEGYKFKIPTRPLNASSLTIGMFPSITSVTINGTDFTTIDQLVNDATATVAWTLPASTYFKSFEAWIYANSDREYFKIQKDALPIDALGTSFVINNILNTVNSVGLYLRVVDPTTGQRYSFQQSMYVQAQQPY